MIETIIPALIPVAVDGVRGLVNRFTGGAGAKPSNVSEVIKLMEAETGRLKALAEMEQGGQTYQWVEAVRKLQRPFYGASVLLAYMVAVGTEADQEIVLQLGQWAQMFGFYLFGDRTYMYLKTGKAK